MHYSVKYNVCTSCNFFEGSFCISNFYLYFVIPIPFLEAPIQFKPVAELYAFYITSLIFLYLNNSLQAPTQSSLLA